MKTLLLILLLVCFPFVGFAQTTSVPAQAIIVNKQTGTTYTVLNVDRARLVTFCNVSAVAVSLPRFSVGWYTNFENRCAGTVTVTLVSGFVDVSPAATIPLTTNQGVFVASDGTNYFTGARGKEVATGTVTSVSGTTNQIDVATGTTTPVISLSSTLVAPGTVTATTSIASPFYKSTAADPADAGALRLGNNEFIEWEKATTGTDWTLGVNASDVLITNADFSALTLTGQGLTSGRVPIITTSGKITDDADMTFATDALTVTKQIIGGGSAITSSGAGGALGTAAFTNATAYEVPLTFSTGLTRSTNTITINTSQNIATLSNLTNNGLVTTSGGVGTLSITVPGTGVLTALGVNVGSAGAPVLFNGAGGSPSSLGTLPAHTLGGTVSGGGNQINNVIIGTSTPLAGAFTTVNGSTSITDGGLTSGRVTFAGASGILSDDSDMTFATDTLTVTKLGATTLTGTISGGGQQLNNIIVGTSTPLAGNFTTVTASTSVATNLIQGTAATVIGVSSSVTPFSIKSSTNSDTGISQMGILHNDAGGTEQPIAIIRATASASGLSGTLDFFTYNAGSAATKLTIGPAGTITATSGLTNAAGTPGSLCYNTSTFEVTKNNALTCTVSSRDFKRNILDLPRFGGFGGGGDVGGGGAGGSALAFDKLRPVQFSYRCQPNESNCDPDRVRYGFIAEEVAAADRRFADGYDAQGIPRSLDQNAILAVTVKEVQGLKAIVADQAKQIFSLGAKPKKNEKTTTHHRSVRRHTRAVR